MNHPIEAALARCTVPDSDRSVIAAPCSGVVDGRAVAIATDGKKILMVDDLDGDFTNNAPSTLWAVIRRHNLTPTHRVTRDALIAWAGTDYRRPCEKCDEGLIDRRKCEHCTDGWAECNLGHEHECRYCNGEGFTGKRCDDCAGTGNLNDNAAPISIPALAVTINAHLIGGLFDLLPGDDIGIAWGPLHTSDDCGVVSFRGDGWLLILAGMRSHEAPLRTLTCTMENTQ